MPTPTASTPPAATRATGSPATWRPDARNHSPGLPATAFPGHGTPSGGSRPAAAHMRPETSALARRSLLAACSAVPAEFHDTRQCPPRLCPSALALQRVADRLHPDQAVAEHEGVDAVLDKSLGRVSGPLQEEHVVLVHLRLQVPGRVRHIGE